MPGASQLCVGMESMWGPGSEDRRIWADLGQAKELG